MKTLKSPQDIAPVFDFRDGGDCAHLQFKTWSEMGLRWNSYREMSLTGTAFRSEWVAQLLAECKRQGWRVIAVGLHNYAASICIAA